MVILRLLMVTALLIGLSARVIAQEHATSASDIRAQLEARISTVFRQAEWETCKTSSKKTCNFAGLILESQGNNRCSDTVVPIDRYRVGAVSRYGIVMTATVSIGGPTPTDIRLPILFLTKSDEPQEICAPEHQIIADIKVGIYFDDWAEISQSALKQLPGAQEEPRSNLGIPLSHLVVSRPAIRAPGILDWIFNSGRQEPVKLRINSEPVGGAVYVGKRLIGTTAQEFGLTPSHIKDVYVVIGGKRMPISECTQIGSGSWVKVFCKSLTVLP